MTFSFVRLLAVLAAGLSSLLLCGGCETDDDEFDRTPPAGKGSLVIDNYTSTDIEFFLEGKLQGVIDDDDDRTFDFDPGVYRVVLNEEDGTRSWADDVDVLEGRVTVLHVVIDTAFSDSYTVTRNVQ
jgi:hypothetical protein